MGRISRSLWVLLGLVFFTVSVCDFHVSADVIPSENECRPYIEKAIHELKNIEATGAADDKESTETTLDENASIENEPVPELGTEEDDVNNTNESVEENSEKSAEDDKNDDNESDETTPSQENQTEENASVEEQAAGEETVSDSTQENESNQQEESKEENESVENAAQGDNDSVETPNEEENSAEKTENDNESAEKADTDGDSKENENDVDSKEAEEANSEGDSKEGDETAEIDSKEGDETTEVDSKEGDETAAGEDSKEVDNDDSKEDDEKPAEGTQENDEDSKEKEAEDDSKEGEAGDDDANESAQTEENQDEAADKDNSEQADENEESAEKVNEEAQTESVEETQTAEEQEDSKEEEKAADANDDSDEQPAENESQENDNETNEEESVEEKVRVKRSVDDNAENVQSDEQESVQKDDDESQETANDSTTDNESQENATETNAESQENSEQNSEEDDEEVEQGVQEENPEEDLTIEFEIPKNLRPRGHVSDLLGLDAESSIKENALKKTGDVVLKDLKRIYDNAVKPLENMYKYRELSNRHYGDPEIFSKPLVLFMGPWSGGKSTILNYLTDNEYTPNSIRSGAEPSPAYFNILMHGDEPEVLDGTQLAADWTFSGLQKFGQGLMDRLRGQKLPSKLLERVNIVEIPGILEVRKQVSRYFPFNDACQWFIDRADIIFLVYDPSKLDVGPETEAILDQLKGREYQTRILLNKADQVKPEELLRVQSALIWNISPLMSSAQPPVMYTVSLWSHPFEHGSPIRLLQAQERALLIDLREAIDRRIENKIASARRFAVRIRNHAKMVDCYLTTYYNQKGLFSNKKQVADKIIEHPQNYNIYEGLSTLTNISRYDLPDPEVYLDFFRLNPLYDFKKLSETCTYFKGCPINKLDIAIAYDLPELVGKYKKLLEQNLVQLRKEYDENCNQTEIDPPVKIIKSR